MSINHRPKEVRRSINWALSLVIWFSWVKLWIMIRSSWITKECHFQHWLWWPTHYLSSIHIIKMNLNLIWVQCEISRWGRLLLERSNRNNLKQSSLGFTCVVLSGWNQYGIKHWCQPASLRHLHHIFTAAGDIHPLIKQLRYMSSLPLTSDISSCEQLQWTQSLTMSRTVSL